MYTMKSHSLNSITCDDNGAHIQKRTAKTNYFITRKSNSTEIKAQIIPKNGRGEYFYKEWDGRYYTDVHTAASDINTVERYYRRNKSIPSLRNLIVQVKQANETNYRPSFCVIYSRSPDEYCESHPIIQSHGNSKFQTEIDIPYVRTSKAILHQETKMVLSGTSAAEIYGTQLTQSVP